MDLNGHGKTMSLDEAQRALADILSMAVVTPCEWQLVCQLCQLHQALALESFVRNERPVTPLGFLMETKAELRFIEIFVGSFPNSLTRKDECSADFPLHVACAMSQPVEGLVSYLAKQNPKAVVCRNTNGDLPINVLLASKSNGSARHSSHSCNMPLLDVQLLANIYPASLTMAPPGRTKTPLDIILELPFLCQNIMKEICSHIPQNMQFYQLQSYPSPVVLPQAQALSLVLEKMTVFECKRNEWELDGWIYLLSSLKTNTCIRSLSLVLPNFPGFTEIADHALQSMVSHNTTVTTMSLFAADCTASSANMTNAAPNLTNVVIGILEQNTVQSMTLGGVYLKMDALVHSLTYNNSLSEWNIECCNTLDFHQLLDTIEKHNTSIKKIVVPPIVCHTVKRAILYWTVLNRFGRKQFRRTTTNVDQVWNLMETLNDQDYVIQQGMRIEMYQLRYGLLRESPGLWSQGW